MKWSNGQNFTNMAFMIPSHKLMADEDLTYTDQWRAEKWNPKKNRNRLLKSRRMDYKDYSKKM